MAGTEKISNIKIYTNIAEDVRAGNIKGNVTLKVVCQLLAPEIADASSKVGSILFKEPLVNIYTYGV